MALKGLGSANNTDDDTAIRSNLARPTIGEAHLHHLCSNPCNYLANAITWPNQASIWHIIEERKNMLSS